MHMKNVFINQLGSQNEVFVIMRQVEIFFSQVMHTEVKTQNKKTTNDLVNLYVNSLIRKKQLFHWT